MRGVLLFVWAMLFVAECAIGAPVIDQEYDPLVVTPPPPDVVLGVNLIAERAQTFTVGITGTLTELQVQISRNRATATDLQVSIRRTVASGAPTEPDSGTDVLASVTIPASAIPIEPNDPRSFTAIAGLSIPVAQGDVLAMVLRSPVDQTGWRASSYGESLYPGGQVYRRNLPAFGGGPFTADVQAAGDIDAGFRTFVEPDAGTPQEQLDDVITGLEEIVNAADPNAAEVADKTLIKVNKALDKLQKPIPDLDGAVKRSGQAVNRLTDGVADGKLDEPTGTDLADRLVAVAREIAQTTLADADAALATCTGNAEMAVAKVADANDALAVGDALRTQGLPSFEAAVDSYEDSVDASQKAIRKCT